MLKNLSNKVGLAIMSVVALAGYNAQAAADTDLATGFASTTAVFTDNKGQIILYIVGIMMVVLIIGMVKRSVRWGIGQAFGIFGGRRRR